MPSLHAALASPSTSTAASRSLAAVAWIALASAAPGCAANLCEQTRALPTEGRVLAVGDSILAWNGDRCQSIPDHASLIAGTAITNRSVSGARVLGGDGERPAIPAQYASATRELKPGERWDVVIVDGGGNDLNGTCACGDCARVLDALVAFDDAGAMTGAMPALIDDITGAGARVVLVDYFGLHDDAWYGFDRCGDALTELQARYERLDAARDDVTLVDLGALVTPASHPEAYTFDNVHPSVEGGRLLGPLVAAELE